MGIGAAARNKSWQADRRPIFRLPPVRFGAVLDRHQGRLSRIANSCWRAPAMITASRGEVYRFDANHEGGRKTAASGLAAKPTGAASESVAGWH